MPGLRCVSSKHHHWWLPLHMWSWQWAWVCMPYTCNDTSQWPSMIACLLQNVTAKILQYHTPQTLPQSLQTTVAISPPSWFLILTGYRHLYSNMSTVMVSFEEWFDCNSNIQSVCCCRHDRLVSLSCSCIMVQTATGEAHGMGMCYTLLCRNTAPKLSQKDMLSPFTFAWASAQLLTCRLPIVMCFW